MVIPYGVLDSLDEARDEVGRLEEIIRDFRAEHGAVFDVLQAIKDFHTSGTSESYTALIAAANELSVAHKAADPHY